ncbi:MAG: PAS domain-containing protein [Eubacterium sp.]|nr:PAS domain-containing protein [Eubacterium sp.]
MNVINGDKNIKGINRRYIFTILAMLALAAAVYLLFFALSAQALDKKMTEELYSNVERGCSDIALRIEDDVKMLSAIASLAEENEESYILNRLRAAESAVDSYMLGVIDAEGVLKNTDGRSCSFEGEEWLSELFDGNIVRGALVSIDQEQCFLSCVPVFHGKRVIGGICCADYASGFYENTLLTDRLSYGLISSEGTILGGDLQDDKNIGNILSSDNLSKFNEGISEGRAVFIKENSYGDDGENIRLMAMPLGINDCALAAVISGDEYKKVIKSYFYPAIVLCIGFFWLTVAVAIISVFYLKRVNTELVSRLDRYDRASRVLGVFYLKHLPDRPGHITYYSKAFAEGLGYEKGEIESLLRSSFERIIYSGDRSTAFRTFEEFYSSSDNGASLNLRLENKAGGIHWYSDYIMKDRRSGEIVSVLISSEKMMGLQGRAELTARRLELVCRASSYYVFELNLKEMELYMSDNLKERLGYIITARDCFRDSVRERLISPHSRKELEAMIRSYRKGDRSFKGAVTVISASGEYVRFNVETEVIGSVINDDVRILAILNEIY